ncbi:MAG: hypothetical protein F4Y27_07220 [Acidimicrobiaceae bacterium]|nr:hypothetical protein [Acidimicrobiaceae bacterium]MXW61219.1 hypothetical protein [Acidimicrobiaceae bacterium]MXW76866.1 hypothetical protein [Acidimicrobiaceae bacterium]MYA74449.1 hypothetical protein [Acidimicrobiaceae bacterium]MYC41553.1 hypothetical protein [Acidimicrobiaceae bacterium]
MNDSSDDSEDQARTSDRDSTQASLWTDRTTIAALLVLMSAAVFVVIAITNRHDHSSHVHPTASVVSDVSDVSDVSASDPAHDHSTHVHAEYTGATFVSTERISPPEACRTIIGCDDAGPKPQSPGDRGGWAQFMTLGAVAIGLTFIATKIIRAARKAKANI